MAQNSTAPTTHHLDSIAHCEDLLLSLENHFSNPLRSVLDGADMLSYVEDPTQHSELLRSIKYATRKVLRTTNQLAEIVRFDRCHIDLDLEQSSLRSMLHESVICAREELHGLSNSLIVDFPTADAIYEIDRIRVTNALGGLLIAAQSCLDRRYTLRLSCDPIDETSISFSIHIAVLTPLDQQHRSIWRNILESPATGLTTESLQFFYTATLLKTLGAITEFTDIPPTLTVSFSFAPIRIHRAPSEQDLSRESFSGKRVLVFDSTDSDWTFLSDSIDQAGGSLVIDADPSFNWQGRLIGPPDVVLFRQPENLAPALTASRSLRSLFPSEPVPVLLLSDALSVDDLELSRSFADAVLLSPYTESDIIRYLDGLARPDRRTEPRSIQLY